MKRYCQTNSMVSEWTVTLLLFRAEATPLGKSGGAVELEIGST